MRPGVHASVFRTHTQASRRIHDKDAPQFSFRKLIVLVTLGLTLLLPGVGLSIVGFKDGSELDPVTAQSQSTYKWIGPIGCMLGALLLVASGIYYWCYGTAEARRAHAQRHKALLQKKAGSISHTFVTTENKAPSSSHHRSHTKSHPRHPRDETANNHLGSDHQYIKPMLPLTEENLQQFNNHQHLINNQDNKPAQGELEPCLRKVDTATHPDHLRKKLEFVEQDLHLTHRRTDALAQNEFPSQTYDNTHNHFQLSNHQPHIRDHHVYPDNHRYISNQTRVRELKQTRETHSQTTQTQPQHHVIIVTDDHGVPEKLSDQKFDFSSKIEAPMASEESVEVSVSNEKLSTADLSAT